jgi:hypothetical protein
MSGDFFDPTPEQQVVVLVESATLCQAERLIESCEHCNDDGAQIPLIILDRITGSDPSVTDYILQEPAKCPNCRGEILEKTLIEHRRCDRIQAGKASSLAVNAFQRELVTIVLWRYADPDGIFQSIGACYSPLTEPIWLPYGTAACAVS